MILGVLNFSYLRLVGVVMYYHVVVSSFFESDFSNPFINSFTYLTTEIAPTTAGAFELGEQLRDALFNGAGALMATTSTALRYATAVVKAPQVPSVLAVVTIDQTGDVAGDYMPRFVSYSLSSVRVRGDVRQGTKRFGGVPESLVTNGVLSGGAIANLNAVKGQLGDVITGSVSGVSTDFTPIIVKRVPYTTSSGGTAYRLPEGLDPFVYATALEWVVNQPTTQNSRKN